MTRLGFRWTEWSTPPVTATVVVVSWALAFAAFAGLAGLFGFDAAARTTASLAKAFLAGGGALLGVALAVGLAPARRSPGRRTVERPLHR